LTELLVVLDLHTNIFFNVTVCAFMLWWSGTDSPA